MRGRAAAQPEEDVPAIAKLGSLSQKARGKQLKQARGILLVIGVLTILFNGIGLFTIPSQVQKEIDQEVIKQGGYGNVDPVLVQKAKDRMLFLNLLIPGIFLFSGVLFVIFGAIIYRFPVVATVTSLVMYLLATVVMVLLNPVLLATGAIFRIIFVIALAKAVQSAFAYEKERRLQEDFGPV